MNNSNIFLKLSINNRICFFAIIVFCLIIISCNNVDKLNCNKLQNNEHFIGSDVAVIDDKIYKYDLYSVSSESINEFIKFLTNKHWNNKAYLLDINYSEDNQYILENNDSLSNNVKLMMMNRNSNISTTEYFKNENDKIIQYYIVNYTKDYITYSIIVSFSEIDILWKIDRLKKELELLQGEWNNGFYTINIENNQYILSYKKVPFNKGKINIYEHIIEMITTDIYWDSGFNFDNIVTEKYYLLLQYAWLNYDETIYGQYLFISKNELEISNICNYSQFNGTWKRATSTYYNNVKFKEHTYSDSSKGV